MSATKIKKSEKPKSSPKIKSENKSKSGSKSKYAASVKIASIAEYYDLPKDNMTAVVVLHKMSEILESYLKIIQQILQPEEFHSLHECAMFDDSEKSNLFELYSRIIVAHREILKALIMNTEKDYLFAIESVHSEILAVKPMMFDVVKKMQHAWKLEAKKDLSKGTMHYFG